ncbi:MAG: HD domain-containing protein [Candidatus Nanopelagicales bacterium]
MSPGRRSADSASRAALPFLVLAAIVVVASAATVAVAGLEHGTVVLSVAFGAFIAVGEVLRVRLPGEREAAPLAAAGTLAFALLPAYNGTDLSYGATQVVLVTTIGLLVGSVPGVVAGRGIQPDEFARRVLVVTLVAVIFRPLLETDLVPHSASPALALAMVVVAAIGSLADALIASAVAASGARAPFTTTLGDEIRALAGMGSAVGATGILIALATPHMGLWSLPVFALPLLLTWFAFRRYAGIRRTYIQTIRALARVTEIGGYSETGHARRVSALAVDIGRQLGMTERQLVDLEYAALLHDIGQLSLPEPIPGGATTMVSDEDQRRIAELGSAVIRQTGVMDEVALMIERQADPWRPHRGAPDPTLPLGSRIIRAVNAYDDLVGASVESDRRLQALERLNLATVSDYDPDVVAVLTRTVERDLERVG